jgi:hypothetical protein
LSQVGQITAANFLLGFGTRFLFSSSRAFPVISKGSDSFLFSSPAHSSSQTILKGTLIIVPAENKKQGGTLVKKTQ